MQEYLLPVKDSFKNGLRPEVEMPTGSAFLYQCDFAKPTERGLLDPVIAENPNPSGMPFDSWPFPQLFKGSYYALLFGETSVSSVDWDTWTPTALATYDFHTPASAKSITAGGTWSLADFGNTWIATNGACAVTQAAGGTVYVEDTVPFQACCAHRGRGVFAGFDPNGVWPDAWDDIFAAWMAKSPSTFDETSVDIGENFVLWTPIGRDLYALLSPPSDPIHLMRQNQFGFMPMPWAGTVYAVLPLGKDLIVYGENGVARLFPVVEPYPTFGLDVLMEQGIAGRGAAGGDLQEHVFIDADGCLWRLSASEGLQRLGYEEFFVWFVGQEISISLDQKLREFYLSGESYASVGMSFVLSQTGLGTSRQQVTRVFNADGRLYGVFQALPGTEVTVATDRLDFGYKDWKTITTVEVGADTTQGLSVAVDYRNGPADSWARTDWIALNSSGWGRIQKTAKEFRLAIKCSSYIDLHIDYANVHWQPCGRMTRRGLGVNTADA